ncbi:hypothetical protein EJ110_NYTH21762 [Nymphaea thermarum]|nr:hypothetical protein EJ110_NYTH21762 [Nymphaea thermarum]
MKAAIRLIPFPDLIVQFENACRSSVLASTWSSLVNSLPNPPSIRLLFLFCPSPRLAASWGDVWRPWLISAWWRIWEECNNRVLRGTFSSPDSVARRVQGDVQFVIRLKRRCSSAAGMIQKSSTVRVERNQLRTMIWNLYDTAITCPMVEKSVLPQPYGISEKSELE